MTGYGKRRKAGGGRVKGVGERSCKKVAGQAGREWWEGWRMTTAAFTRQTGGDLKPMCTNLVTTTP